MKIVFVINQFIGGGAERYILRKIQWLREQQLNHKYDFIIITSNGSYIHILDRLKIKYITINELEVGYELFERKSQFLIMNEIILRLQKLKFVPDIIELIEAFRIYQLGHDLAKKYRIPFIVNCLSETNFQDIKNIEILKYMNSLNNIFLLSDEYKRCMKENCKFEFENATVIPLFIEKIDNILNNGVNILKYNNKFKILTVSRLAHEKLYIKTLISEFIELCKNENLKNTELIIVGNGELEYYYSKLISKHKKIISSNNNNIILFGFIDDPSYFYSICDIYVGMGTTLLQAAQYKKPCIKASFYPNHIRSCGYYGEDGIINMGEWNNETTNYSFSELIKNLYCSKIERDRIAMIGYQHVESNHYVDNVMKKWVDVYNKFYNMDFKLNDDFIIKKDENLAFKIRKIILNKLNIKIYNKLFNIYKIIVRKK